MVRRTWQLEMRKCIVIYFHIGPKLNSVWVMSRLSDKAESIFFKNNRLYVICLFYLWVFSIKIKTTVYSLKLLLYCSRSPCEISLISTELVNVVASVKNESNCKTVVSLLVMYLLYQKKEQQEYSNSLEFNINKKYQEGKSNWC